MEAPVRENGRDGRHEATVGLAQQQGTAGRNAASPWDRLRERRSGFISKLQPEGVLCRHMKFLYFTDVIHPKHMYCSWCTLRGMCLNTCEKKPKSPRGFCPLSHMIQKENSLDINVYKSRFQSYPFPDVRHMYPGASQL